MLSTGSLARLSSSPPPSNGEQSGVRKRKRKAYSCYDCRRRKLKCDREQPACDRCRKGGLAQSCSYDERPLASELHGSNVPSVTKQDTTTSQPTSPWSYPTPISQTKQTTRIENRLPNLEASQTSGTWQMMGEVSAGHKDKQRPVVKFGNQHWNKSPRPSTPPEAIIFRGENFKTQYYGGSNATSLIAHFPELRLFMRDAIMQHTSLPRAQRDLKALQVRWKDEKTVVLPVTDLELLQFLPNRETTDQLVRLYFDTFGLVYPILHTPSFWKEYDMLWDNLEAASPSFIVTIFLMMAAVVCLSLKERPAYIGDSALPRERAVLWIEVSEWWLGRQSQKHIYLGIWQIRCLLVMSKQVNILKKKKTWTMAGSLVREAMAAGFHRDPSFLGAKVSVFDQEMRRRLWAVMTELELQASIDRGMPSASAGVPSDTANVLNANDEDLDVGSQDPPMQKSFNEYTTTSYLHISRASFTLRASLNSIVNDISSPSRYEDVLDHEEMITEQLKKIPRCAVIGGRQDKEGLPVMVWNLLDVQLRQFLILLHAPFARQAGTNSRYALSRMICFNAATSILDQHRQLVKSGNYTLLLQRHDYFRAALVIAHNLHISIISPDNLFLTSSSTTLITCIDNALSLLEDRVTRLGTGYTHHWYVSAACALIRSAMSPEQAAAQKQQAIDQVARQYYRVLASQEEFIKAKEKLMPNGVNAKRMMADELQTTNTEANPPGMSFLGGNMPQPAFTDTELPLEEFYFGDPAAWTFDNLWDIGEI